MKTLKITSVESLETRVAEVVRLKIERTRAVAEMDLEVAAVQKRYAPTLAKLTERVSDAELTVQKYCTANRAALFCARKSRETASSVFGFELTPPRVEPSARRVRWPDVVKRLMRLDWGKAYVREAEPKPDKEALLADRAKLTAGQLTAAGITFCQDEQFFIRPKAETAETSRTIACV